MSLSRDSKYRNDIILFIALFALSALLLFFGNLDSKGGKATVTDSEGRVYTFDLYENKDLRIETELGYNVISVHDGRICVSDADCPDCSCVKQGDISKKGDKIVCLPHKLIVEIDSEDNTELDSVTY